MNDRYLYRAKRISAIEIPEDKRWIEGYYAYMKPFHYIMPKGSFDSWYRIDEKTLCQCTGIKDKNGKLIWENDIVRDDNGNLYKAFWRDRYYQFSWICVNSDKLPIGAKWDFWSIRNYEIEVIGSTIDNPELLEAGE